jgi:predicted ATPase/class 3 adenylate cyclase
MAAMERGDGLTFFFSDIEGSTRAATALGEQFADALELHRRAVRTAFAAAGGTEVSTAGDSFFAVFPDATSALAAAVEVQRGSAWESSASVLRARIGLHTGHAVRVGDDYLGLDVHRAARIADAGHGGQILVSESTREAVVAALPASLSLVDLGRHRLKDIGPERLWQVAGDGLPAGPFPSPRSLEAHPTNLPAEATELIDREREQGELGELVMGERLVTVTGAGGIGKTRLAIAVARSLVDQLADGVFHLDLASTTAVDAVVSSLIEILALRIDAGQSPLAGLLDRLRNRDLLLVLDTADRVEGLASLAAAVAAACARVHLLVTSRSPLRIKAEREYPLAPLASGPAIDLYVARAAAIRPGFRPDRETRADVARLVERLDGLPLAIELAAARARLLTPAAVLDRLERRLPALGEADRDAPDRQRTVQATIAWSCELLAPPEQAVFRQLGVLEGSFDLGAIEGIVTVQEEVDVTSLVEALVDRSLLVAAAGTDGEPRFRMLAPMREFALDALRSDGSEATTRERHASYWADMLRAAASELDRDAAMEAVLRIGRDEPNIRAALEWFLTNRSEVGAELIACLGRYWRLRGREAEGLPWLGRALAVADGSGPATRADLLFWLGALEDDSGRPAEAAGHIEAALALRRELGDERGIARALNSLGVVARSLGDLERAETLLEESIERARASSDQRGIAMSLNNLGIVASDRGRHDVAVDLMSRALEIDTELGGAYIFIGAANLATMLIRAGRMDDGLERLREALPGIEDIDDSDLVIEALGSVAAVALARGDATAAARLSLAAEALAAAERKPFHPMDRRALDDSIAGASARVAPAQLAAIRGEVLAVDVPAGLALLRNAVEMLRSRTS